MKKKMDSHFSILKNPYGQEKTESIDVIYEKYANDPEAIIEKDGLKFYKIIQLIQIITDNTIIVATLDAKLNLRINDTLIDEKKNCFTINGFEMIHLNVTTFPEWYEKIVFISIVGAIEDIGKYLALYK